MLFLFSCFFLLCECDGDHRELHVLTHSFPTRRSSNLAGGMRMPDWVDTAWRDYARRLPSDCLLELKEVKPEPRTLGKTPAQMMQAEADRKSTRLNSSH